jgi:hypothetical protein
MKKKFAVAAAMLAIFVAGELCLIVLQRKQTNRLVAENTQLTSKVQKLEMNNLMADSDKKEAQIVADGALMVLRICTDAPNSREEARQMAVKYFGTNYGLGDYYKIEKP